MEVFRVKYGGLDVSVYDDGVDLYVNYSDCVDNKYRFIEDNWGNGVQDVLTEYIRFLEKKIRK